MSLASQLPDELLFVVNFPAEDHRQLPPVEMCIRDRTNTSARRHTSARLAVRLWQMVTVAFRDKSIMDRGFPTTKLRPMTTASFPSREIP